VRTFTNFDRGTVYFRHMGVQVSRINTEVYGESVREIFCLLHHENVFTRKVHVFIYAKLAKISRRLSP